MLVCVDEVLYTNAAASTVKGNCTDGSLRLVGGANDSLGLVEVCINSGWGGVCVDRFGTFDAEVICNQLGFSPDGMSSWVLLKNDVDSLV